MPGAVLGTVDKAVSKENSLPSQSWHFRGAAGPPSMSTSVKCSRKNKLAWGVYPLQGHQESSGTGWPLRKGLNEGKACTAGLSLLWNLSFGQTPSLAFPGRSVPLLLHHHHLWFTCQVPSTLPTHPYLCTSRPPFTSCGIFRVSLRRRAPRLLSIAAPVHVCS